MEEAAALNVQDSRSRKVRIETVTVTATARIHFGFLDPSGRGQRSFGSLGLSLDRPRTQIVLRRAQGLRVTGAERKRAADYLRLIAADSSDAANLALDIVETIPAHSGLGSGTQLALAIGTAFSALSGLSLTPENIALKLGRGRRSGIGIGTFVSGGLVLDGGSDGKGLPPIVSRLPFPPDWRVLLLLDPMAKGIHGPEELDAFESLPDFPQSATAELCRRVVLCALPALASGDFARFSAEIGHLQRCMADYFAPLQGGPYTSPNVAKALAWLAAQGITGLGQSSWGPTGFAILSSEEDGRSLLAAAKSKAEFASLVFELACGRNEGAVVDCS